MFRLPFLRSARPRRDTPARGPRLAAILVGCAIALATSAPVSAGQPIDVTTLVPVPPDFYSCNATGGGAICRAEITERYENEPTGILCGTGAGAYEVLDSGVRNIDARREYDRAGKMTRRVRILLFTETRLVNPTNGRTIPYSQHNTDTEVFTIPGDLSSAVVTGRGYFIVTVPGMGTVIHETRNHSSLTPYFEGDPSAIAELCAALG